MSRDESRTLSVTVSEMVEQVEKTTKKAESTFGVSAAKDLYKFTRSLLTGLPLVGSWIAMALDYIEIPAVSATAFWLFSLVMGKVTTMPSFSVFDVTLGTSFVANFLFFTAINLIAQTWRGKNPFRS